MGAEVGGWNRVGVLDGAGGRTGMRGSSFFAPVLAARGAPPERTGGFGTGQLARPLISLLPAELNYTTGVAGRGRDGGRGPRGPSVASR